MVFDLKLGFTCNNDCIHCVVTDKRHALDLSTKEAEKIILEESGLDKLVLTGGEPTVRSDFLHLIKYAKEVGVKSVILQTNGRRFSDFEFAEEASEYLDFILIAIHSHNEMIHEMITQRVKSWKETINGFKNLVKIGRVGIQTQTVLSKLNCDNLLKTYDFIQSINQNVDMNLTFPHPNGSALANSKIVVPKYSSIKKEVHKCLNKYGDKIHIEAIPLCYIHPYVSEMNILESRLNTDAELVKGLDRGNDESGFFDENGIIDDYKVAILSDLRKSDSCKLCIYEKDCFGVWKEYFDIYKNELDLKPIRDGLVISVRTKFFDVFYNYFFKSFYEYYYDYIDNLIVLVDSTFDLNIEDRKKYSSLAEKYNFKLIFLKRTDKEFLSFANHYSVMLYHSLLYKKVISFDDDVVFLKKGLFELFEHLFRKYCIISEKYICSEIQENKIANCIASWIIGINCFKIKKEDFRSRKNSYCDGNDMALFSEKNKNNIYYYDDEVRSLKTDERSTTEYYKHVGSVTCKINKTMPYDYGELDDNYRAKLLK